MLNCCSRPVGRALEPDTGTAPPFVARIAIVDAASPTARIVKNGNRELRMLLRSGCCFSSSRRAVAQVCGEGMGRVQAGRQAVEGKKDGTRPQGVVLRVCTNEVIMARTTINE
ncbi:hypothetical protein HPB50_000714 [Hyalomma asiaticum]|uniref:Uncharacterized protein n=1 Tax=Hyalomma asiaticum TaxID=266040 RepID=A0ACB7STP8_HYAAI|nr:hypothetical protein HPB50_000714 [Hyalomma asiaticum]